MKRIEAEPLFRESSLFKGWTSKQTFSVIKDAFKADSAKMTLLLDRGFDRHKKMLTKKWNEGIWSYGYCYYVAEVAYLMFLSSTPTQSVCLFQITGKKAASKKGATLKKKLNKHFVLCRSGLIFDPERGYNLPSTDYPCTKRSRFQSYYPSVNAVLLLIWIIEHYEKRHRKKKLTRAIRPILKKVADWKHGGQKENLKKLVWEFVGRS
jgi:hypothetical protein